MSEADLAAVPDTPPVTGDALIDAALGELKGSESLPVDEQLIRLSAAHELLTRVLHGSPGAGQAPVPGVQPR